MEYSELRDLMVKNQLIARGIRDEKVLNAMRDVPRHLFVDELIRYRAYDDMALSIGEGQTISQPYMVAIMTELLELKGNEKVLEIGTGSGYQTAVLSLLSKEVYTVERLKGLSAKAEERLIALGYKNICFKVGDGTLGWTEELPFQRVLITAASPQTPQPLIEQLEENGIIVIPVGDLFGQRLLKLKKIESRIKEEEHTPCVFVPLIGKYGFSDVSPK